MSNIIEAIKSNKHELQSYLPTQMQGNVDYFIKSCIGQIQLQNGTYTDLSTCTPKSIIDCVKLTAQLGLTPGPQGLIYYLPYKGKKEHKAQTIIGYKGLIKLAKRSGNVSDIYAIPVYSDEPFKIRGGIDHGIDHDIIHIGERGDFIGCYAVAKYKDGTYHSEWMRKDEIDAIRKRSAAGSNGPWVTDYIQMARKTVIRRLCNGLDLETDIAANITQADQMEFVKEVDANVKKTPDTGAVSLDEAMKAEVETEPLEASK